MKAIHILQSINITTFLSKTQQKLKQSLLKYTWIKTHFLKIKVCEIKILIKYVRNQQIITKGFLCEKESYNSNS